jgi:predicted DNA-binding transcriptional regulator YafY
MKKIERLLAEVLALKQNGRMTAAGLADLLEVNIRTIYRDIDALSQIDVPLIAHPGKDGGYEILDDYFLPSISFTKDEVLALSIAKDLILGTEVPGFEPFIQSAFLKIQNIIPGEERKRIEKITRRILFDLKYIDPEMEGKDYFPLIKKAFEEDRCLLVDYYSSRTGEVSRRLITPYILTFTDGVWYLRGKSEDKSFIWWFRLDRIKTLKLSEKSFTLPGEFDKKQLSYSRNIEGEQIIRIKMDKTLFETIKEDVLFKSGAISETGNEIILSICSDRNNHILEFLFRNWDRAVLLAPEILIVQLKERIENMKKKYL